MTPLLVFDIETVPDIAGLRVLHGLGDALPDADVAAMAFQQRRQASGNDFLQLHLHRVLVISCALRDRDHFKVWSLGANNESEGEVIQRFFDGIDLSENAQAMDAIALTGPGQHFLGSDHTRLNFMSALFRPWTADNNSFEQWQAEGGKDAATRANTLWKKQLESYEDPGLDPAIDEAIRHREGLEKFLAQGKAERADLAAGYAALAKLVSAPKAAPATPAKK